MCVGVRLGASYCPVNNTIAIIVSITGAWKSVIREDSIAITFTIVATELLTCWFVRADCSTADEPGQVPQIGGLSNFGKVSMKYTCKFIYNVDVLYRCAL